MAGRALALRVFMFSASGHIFGGTEGVGSLFHVLRSRTRFRQYRGRRVPFSRFALPDSFSAVPRASGPFFMFCAPGLVFDGTEGVGSLFHVLRSRTRFRRYRVRRVPFSCFAHETGKIHLVYLVVDTESISFKKKQLVIKDGRVWIVEVEKDATQSWKSQQELMSWKKGLDFLLEWMI
jgi:hypothetical protein